MPVQTYTAVEGLWLVMQILGRAADGHRGDPPRGSAVMHAARLNRSERLRRVYELLSDGLEHSTLEIALEARVCAVNSIAAELRANGYAIECRQACGPHGGRIWLYRMTAPAGEAA